jgi:aryl-alcohol dehydrogenase-like predicted oxidoreductase
MKKHNIERERLVIATKYSGPMNTLPNGNGNQKKNLKASLEASLKRLDTDYVDVCIVYYNCDK